MTEAMIGSITRLMGELSIVDSSEEELKSMPEWLWFIAFLAAYIVLMRWVLPRLGVPT